MNTIKSVLRKQFGKVDFRLLIFLLLLLNVKLAIKLLAVVFIYILRPNFRFGLSLKSSRLSLLFPLLILIAATDLILYRLYNSNYLLAFLFGSGIWIICLLVSHQLKLFTETVDAQKIYRTLLIFFIINAAISLAVFAKIIIETGSINPYKYQGNFQKYFINTGDYIKGLSFDTSTTNAAINAFGVLFFFLKRHWRMTFLCLFVLLLTGSNLVNLMLLGCFLYLFLFQSKRSEKSVVVMCLLPMVFFWAKVSPQNNEYVTAVSSAFLKKDTSSKSVSNSLLLAFSSDEYKEVIAKQYLDSIGKKVSALLNSTKNQPEVSAALITLQKRPFLPADSIHTPRFQHKDDTDQVQKKWMAFMTKEWSSPPISKTRLPGKIKAFQQTIQLYKASPYSLLTGVGMGRFSSKLAFKTTGLQIAGNYPKQLIFIDPAFASNHLTLYLSYFTKQERLHSVVNTPNSVCDQLLAEYGLAGLIAFGLFYIGYFLQHRKKLTYGIPILLLMCGLFFTDYWFEQLSIVFLFELFLFLNLKESANVAA